MLILRPVGRSVAGYYLRQGRGSWLGGGAAALGLAGQVGGRQLSAVLDGRDPAGGDSLWARRPARRRAGWDLVFAAPKSVSLVHATSGEPAAVAAAHDGAVRAVVSDFERRRFAGDGLVAAAFAHERNAGGEPHLHTHVLLANLRHDAAGRWRALGTWIPSEELAALYHLGLRDGLAMSGLHLDWRVRADGMVDLADVPRAAVRASSARGHESLTGNRWAGRAGPERPWRERSSRAGWEGPAGAGVAVVASPRRERVEEVVASRLAARGSTFTRSDVIAELARSTTAGLPVDEVSRWAERFCAASIPVGRGRGEPRWTTALAAAADRRVECLMSARVGGAAAVRRQTDRAVLEELLAADGTLPAAGRDAARAVAGAGALVILSAAPGRSNFVADAGILNACAAAWADAGRTAAVSARSRADAARWSALAGISSVEAVRRPDVIVVDQADRRPPGELLNLLASAPDARLVFVEGGTTLRSPRDASLGYARVSSAAARVDPGPEPVWRPEDSPERAGPGAVAGALLSRWADRTDSLLVGLGTAEALALNAAARRHLASEGRIGGPSVSSRGREFAAGDTVIAVRPVGAGLAAGSRGSVLEVDERRARAVVEWSGRRTDLGRAELARVGHGYAATPRLAAKSRGPLLVLGEAAGLGLDRSRVAAEMRVDLRSPALERGRGLGID